MAAGRTIPFGRRFLRKAGAAVLVCALAFCAFSVWFVRHPRAWLEERERSTLKWLWAPVFLVGDPLSDATDSLGITGSDVVCATSRAAPSGSVFFAGAPVRTGNPAPDDTTLVDRGDFAVGWSPSLRHPVWCAYHVPRVRRFDPGKRPGFKIDRKVVNSPAASLYANTGYDRGHMVPNYAMATRFGKESQESTFLMSNISPQTPNLNRGLWREVEHRIADLWTAKWGEIWVIVGTVPGNRETLSGTNIDVPSAFYQILAAQKDGEIRVLAVLVEQEVPWRAWPRRYITSVREIEGMTGFDFFPELDRGTQDALETPAPTRMWTVRPLDVIDIFKIHSA